MWAPYLHHITVHFPIVLTIVLALTGIWSLYRDSDALEELMRWIGWVVVAAAGLAVVSGLVAAPGLFGTEGSAGLRHHRDLGLTALGVAALAAYSFERYARGGHADWHKFAVGLWCVAAFAVVGTAHWGGSELHPDKVPWIEQTDGTSGDRESQP